MSIKEKVRSKLWNKLDSQVLDKIESQVWNQACDKVYWQLKIQIWNQIVGHTEESVRRI